MKNRTSQVAPLAGAWIEITTWKTAFQTPGSLPSRERGLKYTSWEPACMIRHVAPLAGAWIEITGTGCNRSKKQMSLPSRERGLKLDVDTTEETGATSLPSRERGLKSGRGGTRRVQKRSLPSRERGLKLDCAAEQRERSGVAPLAGAWIEISYDFLCCGKVMCRSPRGSVD